MKTIGIMTGNSLDAVDTVITEFKGKKIKDLYSYSHPMPKDIEQGFRKLKSELIKSEGDIEYVINQGFAFQELHFKYINLVADTVNKLIEKSAVPKSEIAAIGFHGQTCAHYPPSIAGTKDKNKVYTLQVGSGQQLADLTGIPVVFDFRSDDIMNGGEGAPLAPIHNLHIAQSLNLNPVAFCNAGNTGNISIISDKTMGWDVGPFNHFIDLLCREEKGVPFDKDGAFGKKGKINFELLRALFESGKDFITKTPPKSSDPSWYIEIAKMRDVAISFEDRIRTVEFFSTYIFAYNLGLIPTDIKRPKHFLVFGGGWKNPIVLQDFKNLLKGKAELLPEHKEIFAKIKIDNPVVQFSDDLGFSAQYMEARLMADMARCKLKNIPFTFPETTGCDYQTICGIIAKPNENNLLLWSRASKGWHQRKI